MRLAHDGYDLHVSEDLVGLIIQVLITSLFVWLAARIVIDRSSLFAAIVVALLGNLLAFLVWGLVAEWTGQGIIGLIAAVLAWGLVAALLFRTAWLKGAVIGVVAWLLWFLTRLLLGALGVM